MDIRIKLTDEEVSEILETEVARRFAVSGRGRFEVNRYIGEVTLDWQEETVVVNEPGGTEPPIQEELMGN